MYIISVMIYTFSIRDFGHLVFLYSQFGHPVMKILAKSLDTTEVADTTFLYFWNKEIPIWSVIQKPMRFIVCVCEATTVK